jgi:hypothetical protein
MRHFVLATNRTTQEQDAEFYRILREQWPLMGWWHQVSETWLLIDLTDTVTVDDIRNAAKEAFPGIYVMVLQVVPVPGHWAGFGPQEKTPGDMFTWIRQSWDPDS